MTTNLGGMKNVVISRDLWEANLTVIIREDLKICIIECIFLNTEMPKILLVLKCVLGYRIRSGTSFKKIQLMESPEFLQYLNFEGKIAPNSVQKR